VFVSLATEPEVAFGLQRRSGLRQPRCPLCGHLVRDSAPDAASFPSRVDRAIRLDHPGWRAEMGVCLQCADVYRALAVRNPQGLPCAPSHRPQTL